MAFRQRERDGNSLLEANFLVTRITGQKNVSRGGVKTRWLARNLRRRKKPRGERIPRGSVRGKSSRCAKKSTSPLGKKIQRLAPSPRFARTILSTGRIFTLPARSSSRARVEALVARRRGVCGTANWSCPGGAEKFPPSSRTPAKRESP